jgi:hypothetical protein
MTVRYVPALRNLLPLERARRPSLGPPARGSLDSPTHRVRWLMSLQFLRGGALAHDTVDPDTGEHISAAEDQAKVLEERQLMGRTG